MPNHPLVQTTLEEARELLRTALLVEPRLTEHGLTPTREGHAGEAVAPLGEDNLHEISACADWIKR